MSLHALPVLIVNMGTEMLYILEQRLIAQSIPSDKVGLGACACCVCAHEVVAHHLLPTHAEHARAP